MHNGDVVTTAPETSDVSPRVAPGRLVWLDAGQELLREHGASAVKLDALTNRTRLSTGSFYHHFANVAAYLVALAGRYVELVPAYLDAASLDDPVARIRRIGEIGVERRMNALDAAMRDWAAAGFGPAREAVAAGDRQLLAFVQQAFEDLGYRGRDGQLRAHMLVAFGAARVTVPWSRSGTTLDDVLDVLAPHRHGR